jgi:GR25 family glycosyltransferase involved in LPS biosynthesis
MQDIYVINLPHRNDRLEKIKSIFSNFNIIVVEGVKHDDPVIGCFLSHKKCLLIAKEKNLKNIVVMEDDCCPFDNILNFTNRFNEIKKYLDEHDNWNIFLGGTIETKKINIVNKIENTNNLFNINIGYCTHLIIYNCTIFDYFLNHDLNKPIDHTWMEKYNAIVSIPFIASQDDVYSDILKSNYSYDTRIRQTNEILVKYIRKKY